MCFPCAVGSYNPKEQATACYLCCTATQNHELFAHALAMEMTNFILANTVTANDTLANNTNDTLANNTNDTLANNTNDTLANNTLTNETIGHLFSLVFSSNTTDTQASESVLQCVCDVG